MFSNQKKKTWLTNGLILLHINYVVHTHTKLYWQKYSDSAST